MLPDSFNKPILITLSGFPNGEAEAIYALQKAGSGIIHIRKPDATPSQMSALLSELAELGVNFRNLTLHYQEDLAREYGCGGIHVRAERIKVLNGNTNFRLSCSGHSWTEVQGISPQADYVFLSPVFDSISKTGYTSRFTLKEAAANLLPRFKSNPTQTGSAVNSGSKNVVALGGIDPDNVGAVRQNGFAGAAVLGAIWATKTDANGTRIDIPGTIDRYHALQRRWEAAGGVLQLISDGDLRIAREFLAGGGRWIQLRMKNTEPSVIIARATEMKTICGEYGAVLLINDQPEIARAAQADGVHLGKGDMHPAEARKILGESAIIGGTANTADDIRNLHAAGVDYIGLGPFRFTTTKKNLSPVLGTEGYEKILTTIHDEGITVPVVAIGGIDTPDIAELMHTGINGIAVSGSLAGAAEVTAKTREMLDVIDRERTGSGTLKAVGRVGVTC